MRILHIVGTMNPNAGGAAELIRMMVLHQPAGYSSEIVTTDPASASFLRELPVPAHGVGNYPQWSAPKLLPWLRENRARFDGAIVHGLWWSIGRPARKAFPGRYAVFPHGMLDPYFKRAFPLKHLKKLPFWCANEYWNLREAQRVLFTTALERDLAAQSFPWLYRVNPMVVPLGTEPPPADEATLREAFYARCPALRNKRFLLYLGRIHPKKGADLLLDAFAKIAQEHADVHLVMAGPGAEDAWASALQTRLPASASARIHWPGMLRGSAKWGAFAACEAFVLPSHQENFGIAVVEALASARPALTTHPVNISPELLTDDAGLVEDDTATGIERLLTRWLNLSQQERTLKSHNARLSFEQRYDIRRNTETILRVFEQR